MQTNCDSPRHKHKRKKPNESKGMIALNSASHLNEEPDSFVASLFCTEALATEALATAASGYLCTPVPCTDRLRKSVSLKERHKRNTKSLTFRAGFN